MAEPISSTPAQAAIVTGERNYERALDSIIASATHELLIFDADFCKGAYASPARHESMRSFLAGSPQRRLQIVLHDTGYFAAHCPRLQALLTVYSHAMTLYQTGEPAKAARDCFVIADRKHSLRRFHIDHARFSYALNDPDTAQMLSSRFGELLEVSARAPVFTLGL